MRRQVIIATILLLTANVFVTAQQVSPLSQFNQNLMYYNPAATGREGAPTANFFYRLHWAGMPGAPGTGVFNVHLPWKNPAVASGLSLEHQSIGTRSMNNIFVHYAHRLFLGDSKISMGIKAGIRNGTQSMPFLPQSETDIAFSDENSRFMLPDFGVGITYSSNRYWASFSVPSLLGYQTNGSGKYTVKVDSVNRDFVFGGGVSLLLTSQITIEPEAMLILNPGRPAVFMINANGIYQETFRFGLGYRNTGALVILAGYHHNKRTRFIYSYDLNFGRLSDLASSSHEISLQYSFGYQVNASNPRGF